MTAGSVDVGPILVPPMEYAAAPPPRPPPEFAARTAHCIARKKLFVDTDSNATETEPPIEIEALYRAEEKQRWERFQIKYNINLADVNKDLSASSKAATVSSTPTAENAAPNLIDLETREYQERLALKEEQEQEKCNQKTENMQAIAETTPQQRKNNSSRNSKRSTTEPPTSSDSCGTKPHLRSDKQLEKSSSSTLNNLGNNSNHHHLHHHQSSCNGRRKPYGRQLLMSECFTVRRSTKNVSGKQQFAIESFEGNEAHLPEVRHESASMGSSPHHQQQQQQHVMTPTQRQQQRLQRI